jgi:hypothetical protein
MAPALPPRANAEHYRKQAKTLVREHRAGAAGAGVRVRLVLGDRPGEPLRLSDAQHVLAREHGWPSWPAFIAAVEAAGRPVDAALAEARAEGEATLPTGLEYTTGEPVVVHVRKRDRRYDIDDDGGGVRAAGRPPGFLHLAEEVVCRHGVNVNRAGVVFVQGFEGRDLARLAELVASASHELHAVLLEA